MRLWISAAAVNGFLALALGAYASHGLDGRAEAELVGWVEAGADTGLAHALALLGVGLLAGRTARPRLTLRLAGWGFLAGSVLFSGGLYVMGVTGLRRSARSCPWAACCSWPAGWRSSLTASAWGARGRRADLIDGRRFARRGRPARLPGARAANPTARAVGDGIS